MLRPRRTAWAGAAVTITIAAVVAAPPTKKEKQPADRAVADAATALDSGKQPAAATIERIMEQAVHNIAVRYNLNETQTELTRRLMKRDVYRFLKEHEDEVWPAIRDMLGTQLGMKPPTDPEELNRMARAARPLVKLAKEAIFTANEEWRAILTPEQKRRHDFDLKEMETQFEKIDENFSQWEQGRAPAGGVFPQPDISGREPPLPPKPPELASERDIFDPDPTLETLVEEFIRAYDLDEGQITAARSILEEFKNEAHKYQDARRAEFSSVADEQARAFAQRDLEGIKKAAATHKELLGPIYELCRQMDERLKALLTTAQIQRHEEQMKQAKADGGAAPVVKRTVQKDKAKESKAEPKPKTQSGDDSG